MLQDVRYFGSWSQFLPKKKCQKKEVSQEIEDVEKC